MSQLDNTKSSSHTKNMKTASIKWCRLIIFHSGFWLVLCVSKTRSRLDVASRFQSAQHSMKALVLDDWIRMQVLGNSVAIEFVILFALFKLGGKFDIAYLMVLWLKASTTNCFSSSFGWKCVMWFIMFVMFPKYFSLVRHNLHVVWLLSRSFLPSIS